MAHFNAPQGSNDLLNEAAVKLKDWKRTSGGDEPAVFWLGAGQRKGNYKIDWVSGSEAQETYGEVQTEVLNEWLFQHSTNPYPSEEQIKQLAQNNAVLNMPEETFESYLTQTVNEIENESEQTITIGNKNKKKK